MENDNIDDSASQKSIRSGHQEVTSKVGRKRPVIETMILYTLASGISLAIFALFALFVPVAESVESIGEWTVSSAQRIRSADNTICNWTFNIHGNSSIGDETDMTPIVCNFAARSDPGRDCGLAAVAQVNCEGSDIWQANTGHSDMGFTVLVLVNQPLYSEAYYGFSDQDLDARNDIAAQTKSAYPIGAVKKRRLAETRDRAPSQSFAAKAQPEAWLVEDVIRSKQPPLMPCSFNRVR